MKKRSLFPHTVLSELTNHWVGYEPAEYAFKHEGYETLVDTAVEMLDELWKKAPESKQASALS